MVSSDPSLDTLLDLDGGILEQEGGFWIKVEAKRVKVSGDTPHGIRYSLTLHDKFGTRVLGYDNAHATRRPKNEGNCHWRDAARPNPGTDDRHRRGRVQAQAWRQPELKCLAFRVQTDCYFPASRARANVGST